MDNTKTDLLQTIEKQVAKELYGIPDFNQLVEKFSRDRKLVPLNVMREVCKRYAFEVAKASLKNASENVVLDSDYLPSKDVVQYYVNMNSITDESNIKL